MAQELDCLVTRVLREARHRGHVDLEATEMATHTAMHQIGGRVLEQLLNADGGAYRGARIPCGHGHHAEFVDHRRKQVLTVLALVAVQRAYYHCAPCAGGVVPKDQELDIVGTTFSPGVRRMLGRVGGQEAFAAGRRDLAELAGVRVTTKAVERVAETLGAQVEAVASAERMRYARFSSQGLFVESGIVEAGCKTVVGFRLTQSGMRWTVRGPMPSLPCAAPTSAAGGRSSGRLGRPANARYPQICRTP